MKQSIPTTMRSAVLERFGGAEVLELRTLPVPVPSPQEVLIAVDTAGVGSWDAEMREGWSPTGETHFPLVLGSDGAGKVAALGSRLTRFQLGDRVYAYGFDNAKGGFYAEYIAVAAERVAHVPRTLDLEHAGAIPTTGLTALQGIDDALHTKTGESIIVVGASGGVGTLAVQFAKYRGARVLAVASGRDGVSLARHLGADDAVDGHAGDVLGAARHFAPAGVDAILALAGGKTLTRCMDALRHGGRVAYPHGVEPVPRDRAGMSVVSYDAVANRHAFDRLGRVVDAAELEVVIAAKFPLEQAAKAHERLARGHVLGKIVLEIGGRADDSGMRI
jgi:NADPH:quinone reductase-like Zn-dependent oxidoreductase